MAETIYKDGVPAVDLCFDTDVLNVWDGASVAQFNVTSLRSLLPIFHELLDAPEYEGCPIYVTAWAKHMLVKAGRAASPTQK